MKCDQVAFYAVSNEEAEKIKVQLGLDKAEWIKDTVTARSIVRGEEGHNIAELQFNYSLGIELEILRYISGPHWHKKNPFNVAVATGMKFLYPPFISHVGIHLDDGEDFPAMEHCKLVQETFTINHTSEYLTKEGSPGFGRKYHYRIHELSRGSYIKYIKRINPK
jgi:hypothetical protein